MYTLNYDRVPKLLQNPAARIRNHSQPTQSKRVPSRVQGKELDLCDDSVILTHAFTIVFFI